MTNPVVIELFGPPRGKGRARAVSTPAGPRMHSDPETVKYETQLRYIAGLAMAGRPMLEGPVDVAMEVRFPIPQHFSKRRKELARHVQIFPTTKPDADNVLKLCDALNEIVFKDDKQVARATVEKIYSDQPGLKIIISERIAGLL
jgi:Holliday junction resolvase RusA-like endonuclease